MREPIGKTLNDTEEASVGSVVASRARSSGGFCAAASKAHFFLWCTAQFWAAVPDTVSASAIARFLWCSVGGRRLVRAGGHGGGLARPSSAWSCMGWVA